MWQVNKGEKYGYEVFAELNLVLKFFMYTSLIDDKEFSVPVFS